VIGRFRSPRPRAAALLSGDRESSADGDRAFLADAGQGRPGDPSYTLPPGDRAEALPTNPPSTDGSPAYPGSVTRPTLGECGADVDHVRDVADRGQVSLRRDLCDHSSDEDEEPGPDHVAAARKR
jgi:hypothetical protein